MIIELKIILYWFILVLFTFIASKIEIYYTKEKELFFDDLHLRLRVVGSVVLCLYIFIQFSYWFFTQEFLLFTK